MFVPLESTHIMFSGFKSKWIIELSCMYFTPLSICLIYPFEQFPTPHVFLHERDFFEPVPLLTVRCHQ